MNDEASSITYHRANNPGGYSTVSNGKFRAMHESSVGTTQAPLSELRGALVQLPFVMRMPITKFNVNLYKGMFAVMVNP